MLLEGRERRVGGGVDRLLGLEVACLGKLGFSEPGPV